MDEICIGSPDNPSAWVRPIAIERDDRGYVRFRGMRCDGSEVDRAMLYLGPVVDRNGEVFDVPIRYFRERLGWDWPPVSGKPGEKLKEEVKRGLRALLALAVADGPLTGPEREILLEYVRTRADQVQISLGGGALNAVEAMIPRMRPAPDVAQYALEKQSDIERNPHLPVWADHHALLTSMAARLIAAGNGSEACLVVFDLIAKANRRVDLPGG
jgi:hypothetical protein